MSKLTKFEKIQLEVELNILNSKSDKSLDDKDRIEEINKLIYDEVKDVIEEETDYVNVNTADFDSIVNNYKSGDIMTFELYLHGNFIASKINKRENWDYSNYDINLYSQKDWNQTLITRVNQISAQINKSTLIGGANQIIVNPKLKYIFNSLDYYQVLPDFENGTLGGRYEVIYHENQPANKIKILNNLTKSKACIIANGHITVSNYGRFDVSDNKRIEISIGNSEFNDLLSRCIGEINITGLPTEVESEKEVSVNDSDLNKKSIDDIISELEVIEVNKVVPNVKVFYFVKTTRANDSKHDYGFYSKSNLGLISRNTTLNCIDIDTAKKELLDLQQRKHEHEKYFEFSHWAGVITAPKTNYKDWLDSTNEPEEDDYGTLGDSF